mgnify:CR=1 FL=1
MRSGCQATAPTIGAPVLKKTRDICKKPPALLAGARAADKLKLELAHAPLAGLATGADVAAGAAVVVVIREALAPDTLAIAIRRWTLA